MPENKLNMEDSDTLSPAEARRLLGQLQEHQIEIDMQNAELRRTQVALEASNNKLNLILNSAAEAIYGIDVNGNCTFCNLSCLRILGYENSSQLIGRNMHELIHHSRSDGGKLHVDDCSIFKTFREGKGTHVDGEVLWRADGTCFSAEYWSYPILNNGKITGAVVTFFDITARRQAEAKIVSLAKFPDENPNPIARIGGDGILLYANVAASKLIAFFDCALGRPVPVNWYALVTQALAGQTVKSFEMEISECFYACDMVPIPEAGYVNMYASDITERKHAEKIKDENIRFNNMLLNSLPHPTMLIRIKDMTVLAANNVAIEHGVKIGGQCWREFGKTEYISDEDKKIISGCGDNQAAGKNIKCRFCQADKCFSAEPRQNDPDVKAFGKVMDTYWVRIDDEIFLHYAVDVTERRQIEQTQLFLLECGYKDSGEDFFKSLAVYLAKILEMDFVCIDRLSGDRLSAKTLAAYFDEKFEDNMEYTLKDTPCGDVVGKTICCFPRGVSKLFPKDAVLANMKAESYIGTTLYGSGGQPIGLIAVIGRKPMENRHLAETIMKLVSIRAAGEIERREAEKALRESEEFTRRIIESSDDCIKVLDLEGRMLSMSAGGQKLLDIDDVGPYLNLSWADFWKMDIDEARKTVMKARSGEVAVFYGYCPTIKGTPKWWEVVMTPIRDDDGVIVRLLAVSRDITGRKLAEDKIKSLLHEKELILKEVHHRIKNNMNTIMCILTLQSHTLKEPSAVAALKDAGSRIQSMAVLYDKLYRSSDFQDVPVKLYLTSLVDEIIAMFPDNGSIKIEKQIEDLIFATNTMFYVGIIVNELLTNAMKYAFTGRNDGRINISFSRAGDRATLIVADNGNGLPESIDIKHSAGFGLQLIDMLTQQIHGMVKIERGNGTRFIIEFEV